LSVYDLNEKPSLRDTILSNDDVVSVHPSTLPGEIWNVGEVAFEPVRASSEQTRESQSQASNRTADWTQDAQLASYRDTYDLSPRLIDESFDVHTDLVQAREETSRDGEKWANLNKMQPGRPPLTRSAFSNWTYASEESSSSASPDMSDVQSATFSPIEDSFSDINSPCRLSHQTRSDVPCQPADSQTVQSPGVHPTETLSAIYEQPTSDEVILPLPTVGSPTESDMKRQATYFELPVGFYGSASPGDHKLSEENTPSEDYTPSDDTMVELREAVSLLMKQVSPHLFEGPCHPSRGGPGGSDDLVDEFGYLGEAVM